MAKRVEKGEQLEGLPADSWNEFVAAAKRVADLPAPANVPRPQSSMPEALTVEVSNETGGDLTADFPIIRLTGPPNTPADRAAVVYQGVRSEGAAPDSTNAVWGVMQGPVLDGSSRRTVIRGATWVTVNVVDEADTTCGPTSGEVTKLTSGSGTATILWKPSGTGDLTCVVVLGGAGGSVIADMLHGVVDSYDAVNAVITLKTSPAPIPLPTGTPALSGTIKVYDEEAIGSFSDGQHIFAIKDVGVLTYDPGTGSEDVNWRHVPTAAGVGVVTRNFELTEQLNTADVDATWFWLEDDLVTACPDSTPILFEDSDPFAEFSGFVGARGRATLVLDPCNLTTRWEITHLEQPAAFVCGTLGATYSGSEVELTYTSHWGDDWHGEDPSAQTIKIVGCYPDDLPNGTKVTGAFDSLDDSEIHYKFVDYEQPLSDCGLEIDEFGALALVIDDIAGNGLAAGSGCSIDVQVGCGIEISAGAVAFKASDVAGDGLVTGTGCTLNVNPGCGIEIVANAVKVKPSDLAGDYLSTGSGCTLNVDNQDVTVITGCDDPFVTFDGSGNPSFHFTTASIRVLAVNSTGTVTCDADGTLSC